jgi:hypothetical protein
MCIMQGELPVRSVISYSPQASSMAPVLALRSKQIRWL